MQKLTTTLAAGGLAAALVCAGAAFAQPMDGSHAGLSDEDKALLAEVIAGDHRTAEEKARDEFRNPAETLALFGVKSDMTVIEIWPGGGWYSNIIAPYVKRGGGTYYAAHWDVSAPDASERLKGAVDRYTEKYSDQDLYGNVEIVAHGPNVAEIVPDGTADVIVTFRNLHNWMPAGWHEKGLADIYKALKPGGIFGMVDHRASDDEDQDPKSRNGRVREDFAIEAAEAAGFMFMAASDLNNNDKDTRDQPFGVWTLPPTLAKARFGEEADPNFDQAPFKAVGESDRFTLIFVKPREE